MTQIGNRDDADWFLSPAGCVFRIGSGDFGEQHLPAGSGARHLRFQTEPKMVNQVALDPITLEAPTDITIPLNLGDIAVPVPRHLRICSSL